MRWFELYPRVDIDYSKVDIVNLLGRTFAVLYYRDDKYLHFYVNTMTSKQSLSQVFGVNEVKKLPDFQYYVEFLLKKEKDFPYPLEVHDLHSFINSFEKGDGLLIWAVLDNRLRNLHSKHMNRLLAIKKSRQKYNVPSEDIDAEAQIIRNKMKEDLFYLKVAVLSSERLRALALAEEFKQYVNFQLRTDGNALLGNYLLDFYFLRKRREKAIYNILYIPPRLPRFPSLYQTLWLNMNRSSLPTLVIVPNPSVVKIRFSRSAQLPMTTVERHDIEIGHLEDGTPFKLDLEDFYRHVYIVGATGSGKSTTITKIVVEMKKLTNKKKAQVVIDPNHDLARDLSIYADYYFDASIPNFAINPLQLPNVFENRKDNISLGVSIAVAILEKMLGLVETAVNVKYIFQVLLSKLYEKTDNPTLQDIYELVLALRNDELDLDVNDEVFAKEVEALQQMPAQSFISLLSRLKPFVENEILRKVTGPSTINWSEILQDNALILFDTGKNKLGEIPSYLVQASIITSLFYWVLQRSIKSSDRMPILTYIDEFQNVAHLPYISEILAEARKYGMHLIMANQNLAQLEEAGVLEHVLSNTNVKFIMAQSSPRGQELAMKLDRAFSEELQEVVPNLSVGEAVVFMRARPGEKTAPFKVIIDKIDKVGTEEDAKNLAKKTAEKFAPRTSERKDTKTMLNPILKYCEVPKPLEQFILYYIWKSPDHTAFQADLLKDLGIDKEKLREVIAKLQQDQYITTEKVSNKLKLQYNRGLFRLKGIVDNEEGKKIAMKVMVKYLEKGYTVVRGKQEGDIRPDLVAFLVDKSTFRPKYTEAIAIEIESPNELEVHPEQVRKNMQKYLQISSLFKEIHVWTSEDKFDKLREIYDSFLKDQGIPQDYKNKVKIFSVRIKAKEKKIEKTGELLEKKQDGNKSGGKALAQASNQHLVESIHNNNNGKERAEAQGESIATSASAETKNAIARSAVTGPSESIHNNNNGLEARQDESNAQSTIELQLQNKIIRINKDENTIEIDGKKYKIPPFELRTLINRRNSIIAIEAKENKIVVFFSNETKTEIKPLP